MRFTLLLALVLTFSSHTHAVPMTVGYQGYLTDSTGAATSSPVSVTFALYDDAAASSALWSETQVVTPVEGQFAVILGNSTPLVTELFRQPLFLGITIADDAEMTPRLPLNSVPFAIKAGSAFDNVVFVPLAATPAASGQALIATMGSLVDAGEANPYMVQLDAGHFDLGEASLTLPAFVLLQGAGRGATRISSTAGILSMGESSSVMNLDLGLPVAAAAETLIQHVDVDVARDSADPTFTAVGLQGINHRLADVRVRATGAGLVTGIGACRQALDPDARRTLVLEQVETVIGSTDRAFGISICHHHVTAHGLEVRILDGVAEDAAGLRVFDSVGVMRDVTIENRQTVTPAVLPFFMGASGIETYTSPDLWVSNFDVDVSDQRAGANSAFASGIVSATSTGSSFSQGAVRVSSDEAEASGLRLATGTASDVQVTVEMAGSGSAAAYRSVFPSDGGPASGFEVDLIDVTLAASATGSPTELASVLIRDSDSTRTTITDSRLEGGDILVPEHQLGTATLLVRNSVVTATDISVGVAGLVDFAHSEIDVTNITNTAFPNGSYIDVRFSRLNVTGSLSGTVENIRCSAVMGGSPFGFTIAPLMDTCQ